jgi:hypothetical protein
MALASCGFFHLKFTFASTFRNYVHVTVTGRSFPPEASLLFRPYAVNSAPYSAGDAVSPWLLIPDQH